MAKKSKGLYAKIEHEPIFHKTSIGRNPSLTKMNKSKRRQFKKYNGQGRWQLSNNILYIQNERNIMTDQTRWGIDMVQQKNKARAYEEQKTMRDDLAFYVLNCGVYQLQKMTERMKQLKNENGNV